METKKNYKSSKKDLKLLSACEEIGLKIGAMIRKRSTGEMALMMDVSWYKEKPLFLGHIIENKYLAFEHIRLARKYYTMIYNHKSIHHKEAIEKPVMEVKKPIEVKPPATFKF